MEPREAIVARRMAEYLRMMLVALGLVAVVGFVAGCGGGASSSEGTDAAEQTEQAEEAEPEEAEPEEQVVTLDGLSLTVPSAWEVKDADNGDKQIYSDEGLLQISSAAEFSSSDAVSLTELYHSFATGMEKSGAVVKGEPEVSSLRNAVVFRADLELPEQGYEGTFEVLFSGNKLHLVMFALPKDASKENFDEMLAVLDSATLKKNEEPVLAIDNGAPAEEEDTTSSAEEPKEEATQEESERPDDEISEEFKAAMDSYEAFFDEYVEFMKRYKENPSDLELLTEASDMMVREADMIEEFDAWEEKDLTDAEMAYYLEVHSRIYKKLAEVL